MVRVIDLWKLNALQIIQFKKIKQKIHKQRILFSKNKLLRKKILKISWERKSLFSYKIIWKNEQNNEWVRDPWNYAVANK